MTAEPYQATDLDIIDEDAAGTGQLSQPRVVTSQGADAVAGEPREVDPAADPDVIVVATDVVDGDVIETDSNEDTDDDRADDGSERVVVATGEHAPVAVGLGQQWHDIQAMFVDDPLGSVQQAAAEADAAVSALAAMLRERQATFASASGSVTGTEQLRESLRSYRIFCQSLTEIEDHLSLSH